jgi:hypothetical protein
MEGKTVSFTRHREGRPVMKEYSSIPTIKLINNKAGKTMRRMGAVLLMALILTMGVHHVVLAGPGFAGFEESGGMDRNQDDLSQYIWPDFRVKSVRVMCQDNNRCLDGMPSLWRVEIVVENLGGNKWIHPDDYMPFKVDILQCEDHDIGQPDFPCRNTRMFSGAREMFIPAAGERGWAGFFVYLRNPHDVYVYVNAYEDGTPGPYHEHDSPDFGNNQASLRIIRDTTRSSNINPYTWIWPNNEDTLIY